MSEISLLSLCKVKNVTECISHIRQSFLDQNNIEQITQIKLIFANARPSFIQCTKGPKPLSYNKLIKFNKKEDSFIKASSTTSSKVSVSLINCYLDILKESNYVTKDLQLYLYSDLSEENILCFYQLISDKNYFTAQDFEYFLSNYREINEETNISSLLSQSNKLVIDTAIDSSNQFKNSGTLIGSNKNQTLLYLYSEKFNQIIICKNKKKKDAIRKKISDFIDFNFVARVKQENKKDFMEFTKSSESCDISLNLAYDDKQTILYII